MPALSFTAHKINLSYSYDTLTVYPKCEHLFESPDTFSDAFEAYKLALYNAHKTILNKFDKVREIVLRNDDHDLYHHDEFQREKLHYHLNFGSELNRSQLNNILDMLIEFDLFTSLEKTKFLRAFDHRNASVRIQLDAMLLSEKPIKTHEESKTEIKSIDVFSVETQAKNIICFIETLEDNELLVELHKYLLSEKFNYLRINKEGAASIWQGTDEKEVIIKTSKSWAIIERSISLQMSHNIATYCRSFSSSLATTRSKQLSLSHKFFSIQRNLEETDAKKEPLSPSFIAFREGDKDTLDSRYKTHFNFFKTISSTSIYNHSPLIMGSKIII